MTTTQPLVASDDACDASAPPDLPSPAGDAVQIFNEDELRLEVCYFDAPQKCRRWVVSREHAHDLVRWWTEQGCTQAPRGASFPEQRFGRIFVLLLSPTQVYFRGSDASGRPNATGYHFSRDVVEALVAHFRDQRSAVDTDRIGGAR